MKISDNHYLYRLETQNEDGSIVDFQEVETIEPLRSVGDIHDELDLENNKQIKRIEEIVFTGDSSEYWYNDDVHTTDTHFVAYMENIDLYCHIEHHLCETDRNLFEFGDVHVDENKNFFCTSVESNGMNRIYISIAKSELAYTVYSHETLKEYFKDNPTTVWYVLRYPIEIPRLNAKGYVITHDGSTTIDVQPQTTGKVIPIVKATIEDTVIEMDSVPTMTINNTDEGNQITDLTFEGVTLVNNAKADNIKGTKEVSHTRYDFAPFYDGQTIINNTIEGGYVSAKLYGDTMINIAKSYGETDLLTMTDDCAVVDLLGDNADGVILADGTITEGRIYGDSEVIDETILSVKNPTIIISNYDTQSVTLPYELNKLPNGVADYIDVVNGVYVQRVGKVVFDGSENWSCPNHLQKDETVIAVLYGQAYGQIYNNGTNKSTGLCDKLDMGMGATTKTNIYNPDGTWVLSVLKTELSSSTLEGIKQWLSQKQPTVLGQLKTPIYTPLTEEEKASLPLSAYSNGYIQLSSDELRPSKFEFRAKSSNRMQLDMLETGYYYLDAPTGNVKLGNVDIDVTEMPCIINVSDANSKRLISDGIGHNITVPQSDMVDGGYFDSTNGVFATNLGMCYSPNYYEILPNTMYGLFGALNMRIHLYDEGKNFIKAIDIPTESWTSFTTPSNTKYLRFSYNIYYKKDYVLISNPITLSKLPSHRIPTTFTQGMKSSVNFGYWQGIENAKPSYIYTTDMVEWKVIDGVLRLNGDNGIELHSITGKYGTTVTVEDEIDISTGKYTKRVGKYVIDGSVDPHLNNTINFETNIIRVTFLGSKTGIKPKNQWGSYGLGVTETLLSAVNFNTKADPHVFVGSTDIYLFMRLDSFQGLDHESVKDYFRKNPMTVYYELETPEITYLDLERNEFRTASNKTNLQAQSFTLLKPQVKLAPLSYPTTLSPNTQYTVFHNRKNYNGSVKTPMINLGGTEVAATGSRTVVTTPSTLAHNELQFIGGENTVEQVMVVHGDWTKEGKTVDYFEGLQSSVIGDKTLENLVDKPINILSNNVTKESNGGAVDYVSMDDIVAIYGNRPKLPEVQVDTNVRTYGMTLQNLVESASTTEIDVRYDVTLKFNAKQNTTYTFICDVDFEYGDGYADIKDNSGIYCGFLDASASDWNHTTATFYSGKQYKGKVAIKVTTTTDNSISNKFRVRFYQQNVMTKWSVTNFIILEGDYSNQDISYFEGMKSVENPVLTSIGKNLFDGELEKGGLDVNTGLPVSHQDDRHRSKNYIKVQSSTKYVLYNNYSSEMGIREYDEDYNFISWSSLQSSSMFTTSNNTKYLKFIVINPNDDNLVQLEQSEVPTSYEPNKSSILSTPQGTVLRGVGSYKDVIGWNDGIIRRNCVEFTISGEEGYNYYSIQENTNTVVATLEFKKLGLENKVPGYRYIMCDKIPYGEGSNDVVHFRQDGNKPSKSLMFWFDKTKFSTYTSQGINDYIKSIGGLTIVAPLANTEYEDVEITGGGNWDKIVLDGNINWSSASEGDNVNGFSVWIGLGQLFGISDNNDYVKYRLTGQTELKCINYNNINPNTGHFIAFARQTICINVKGCHSLNDVKTWLNEHPIDFWYQMNLEYNSITTNTDLLVFNHGTLYTTTDTHPSTFSDFSLKTTNRYTVKDFDKLKYTVLTEQPFYLNGVDYPASSTGMTIIDITGIADSSIYSDDTMITVVQDDGNYYADGVLTQFKGTKTFTKEFIRTSNGIYDTGMTLLEPLKLSSIPHLGVYDTYNTITGTIIKNTHTVTITGYEKIWETPCTYVGHKQSSDKNYSPYTAFMQIHNLLPFAGDTTVQSTISDFACDNVGGVWGNSAKNRILGINAGQLVVVRIPYDELSEDSINGFIEFVKKNPITFTYKLAEPQIIQATPTSTYISTRPENGNIVAQDIQIQAEYLNYDNEQSIISPRMLGDGDEIRWEQGSQCYVYENDNEYIPLTEYNELFGANLQAQEYTQYAESVDGADIELGVALKEKAVYEQTYVKYEDNVVYPETMENIDETNGVEVDYICGTTWQNPNDLSDIRHLGELREDGQYDVTIRRSGDDEIRLLEGTTHIGLDYEELPPSEFELTFFNSGGVEVGKYGDTTHVLEDCVENSKLASGTIYGQTLVNIVDWNNVSGNKATYELIDTGFMFKAFNGNTEQHIIFDNVKANTSYTVRLNSDKAFRLQIGYDATVEKGYGWNYYNIVVGYNEFTIKTVEAPSCDFINVRTDSEILGQSTASFTNFMIIEGEHLGETIPYFEGISSTVVNGFSSCGKNLFGGLLARETSATRNTTFNYTDDEVTVSCTENAWLNVAFHGFKVKPNTKYRISFNATILDGNPYVACSMSCNGQSYTYYEFREISANTDRTHIVYELNTRPTDREALIRFYGANDGGHGTVRYYNIQLEESSTVTQYEPYQSVKYTLPTPITLRKVGDVCDTFDVVSGVKTTNIDSLILDGNIAFSNVVITKGVEGTFDINPSQGYIGVDKTLYSDTVYFQKDNITISNKKGSSYLKVKITYNDKILTDNGEGYNNYFNDVFRENPTTLLFPISTPTTTQHTLIPSTTQTTQEPTFILPQPLRSVPNGICDRLYWDENKGHYCIEKRVQETILSGKDDDIFTYEYNSYAQGSNTCRFFMRNKSNDLQSGLYGRDTIRCIGSPIKGIEYINEYNGTVGIASLGENGISSTMRVPSSSLETRDTDGVKKYLKNNPQTFIYPLATPEIIDLPHLNEKVELPTQPDIYPIGYKAVHDKMNPEIGLTIPYKVLNMPTQPVNLNFVMDIADYVLTWDDVKEARQYNIILNDEVIATVKEPQYNTGEEMYGYILVEANNEIGDSVSKELYIKTVPNAPAQLTVAHNPLTDYYDFEISFIDKSAIADYYTVQYRVDGGEWIINNIENDKLAIGDKKLWSFSVYEIKESIEVWATATNDVGTNDILPSAIYYMSPTPQWTYRMNSKEVFLRWMDNSPYDVKYKLRYSYLSNGQYQYAYFEGDKEEIGKLYEAVVPLAENDEVAIALCIVSEKENLYCKPVKASKELDPNIVPPLNFNYRWLARGLIEFYWQDQYDVDVEYEYILETMKGSESVWTQVNETITSTDVEGTGTVYRVEYQLEDLEQIRMKVRMKWAMNETQWTETLTTVFIPVEGNPPTYIRRTQTAEGLLVEWEAQAYIDSYHIYVIDNTTKEVLQHLETQDNNIIVDLDYSNSIELAIYEISRFSGGIESDPTDSMVFTPTMSEITMLQNIYQPCVEEHSIEVSTVQKGSKQPYVIHDVSYTPNVESESDLQVNVSTPFIISYHPTEIDVHQVGSKAIADMDLKIKTLDTRTEETVEVMTFERITDTYDMNFQVYTPSVMSYPITLEVSKVRIVCLGDSLTSGHPFYWAETGTGMVEASYPYQLSRRLKNQYEVINSGYGSDTTDRCLARFDRDVLRYFPQYCIFQCGTNDLYWAMAESLNNQEALDMKMKVVRENTMEVVKRCWDNGIIPIIGTLIPRTGATGIYKTALYEHNEWIISWCNEQSASGRDIFYVDFFNAGKDVVPPTPLEDPNNPGAMNPIYDGDRVYDEFGNLEKEGRGIHLNPEGYKIMASAVPLSIFQTYDTGLKMYRDAQCTFEDNYDDSDKLNSFYTIEVDNVRRSKTKTIIRYVKNIGRTQVLFAMYGTDMYNMTMEFIGTDGSRGQFANGLLAPDMVAKVTIEINLGDEDFKASFNMHLASREYSQS